MWRRRARGGGAPQRSRAARLADYAMTLVIFALLIFVILRFDRMAERAPAGNARVIDGDSLALGAERIRLQGIDAPELDQRCVGKTGSYACGRQAAAALRQLIGQQSLACTGRQRDKYDRLLARCRAGQTEINSMMVKTGWAISYGGYAAEEVLAKQSRSGLWAGEFQRPQDWRKIKGAASDPPHNLWYGFWRMLVQMAGPGGEVEDETL